jgi:hypothetical protein
MAEGRGVKLIAVLSVYNEAPFIRRVIAGLRNNGIDRVVAIDGAYQGFPHEAWHSTDGTLEVLKRCQKEFFVKSGEFNECVPWLTLVEAPPDGWPGQEVKRTVYFREADKIAEPGDWLVQVDGDEELVEDGSDFKGRHLREFLASLPPNVTTIYTAIKNFCDGQPAGNWDHWSKIFRWMPGLHYGREHWDILGGNDERIWDLHLNFSSPQARVWDFFRFHHLTESRTEERKGAKSQYENFRAEQRKLYGCMNPNPQIEVTYD